MNIYEIDPTTDERWEDLLQSHPRASIFHSRGWLQALCKTYGYTPTAFTTSPPGHPLTNGIPFCRITGFFGKRRLVALPFSDHCEPLVGDLEELKSILTFLQHQRDIEQWDYVEMRPASSELAAGTEFAKSQTFSFHKLNLCHSPEKIFHSFHKNCVQRKIRRAEREGLVYEKGTTDLLLRKFYQLLLQTRRRHGVPIQPLSWFRNLIGCLDPGLTIRVASKYGRAIASILTLRYKHVLVFKYGCLDRRFSKYGGMQLLLWRAIEEAKQSDLWEFDLGRSDSDNPGLVTFKDRWGAVRSELVYLRCGTHSSHRLAKVQQASINKYLWSHAPCFMITAAGRAFYRHLG